MREIRVATASVRKPGQRSGIQSRADPRSHPHRPLNRERRSSAFTKGASPGYTWVQPLSKQQLVDVAEPVPDGPSVRRLIEIAKEFSTVVMAGLFEIDSAGHVYNCYVTVGPEGFITKFRKLHPFVNPHLTPGKGYNVIDLLGCKIGFLICYDNNPVRKCPPHDDAGCRDHFHAARDVRIAVTDARPREDRPAILGESTPGSRAFTTGIQRTQRTRVADEVAARSRMGKWYLRGVQQSDRLGLRHREAGPFDDS